MGVSIVWLEFWVLGFLVVVVVVVIVCVARWLGVLLFCVHSGTTTSTSTTSFIIVMNRYA
ncbi:hypothetical protein EX30DRAFT_340498 [Ascodesmis nigricans]|uniref:Transmembrane protein n=1 Tax=Ascodesmis nigricans TaxID=341454 RepID=A0A4S2MY40_9PEZI|nr:hypothetical protein EX30DRAFT_340498 [Ascodesmis nigricans]